MSPGRTFGSFQNSKVLPTVDDPSPHVIYTMLPERLGSWYLRSCKMYLHRQQYGPLVWTVTSSKGDQKYGPLFGKWLGIILEWDHDDAERGAILGEQRIFFGT